MADVDFEEVQLGTAPTGVGGDVPRTAFSKINRNFDEIESVFADSSNAASRQVGVNDEQVPLSKDLGKAPAVIDGLRRSVEAASGGKMTVHYTAKGQASYFFVQGAFIAKDADTDLPDDIHPMFRIGGNDVKERFIGAFQGRVVNGELLSLPGVDPSISRNFDSFVSAARACGPGFGLMTNADWAGIGAWCRANDFYPRGNSDYGRDRHNPFETGVLQGGTRPGENAGNDRVLTGSGPASWRHNNTMMGISDLCGNVWEWAPGLRLVDGEIHIIADNDAALNATDLSAGSSAWKAIDAATGALVSPGSSGVVSLAASGSTNGTIAVSSGGDFKALASHGVSADALQVLKLHGMFPLGNDIGDDRISFSLEGERVPCRGGLWAPNNRPGVFTVNLTVARSYTATSLGARPACFL